MVPVAIRTNPLRIGGKKRFVLLGVDFLFRMTAHTERINLRPGIHDIRCGAVAARGPGFVGDMLVGFAVTGRTAHIVARMNDRNVLLHIINMTDETPAVICHWLIRG